MMKTQKKICLAIVDDHVLVSRAIEDMIVSDDRYEVCANCCNGEEFLEYVNSTDRLPEVVLMDVNMPFKNGIETTQELAESHPEIKVIALTMEDNEKTVISMLKAGAKGYLLKDMSPEILFSAIDTVHEKGCFYTDEVTQSLIKMKNEKDLFDSFIESLTSREKEFIKFACSELTYKEIAEQMFLSPKTIDGYREHVFTKLDVKSRVGLVLFALRNNLC